MTAPSSNTSNLPEYEMVIADLVDELHQYKNAVTSLNDAVGASREIHTRAKAVGMMTETVLDRADSILAELQTLDTPSLIPRLSAMEEAIVRLSKGVSSLQDALVSLEPTVKEAARTAHEGKDVSEVTQEKVLRATEEIIDAAKASSEASRVQIAELVDLAVDASREGKNSSDACLDAVRTEIPSTVRSALAPLAAKTTQLTYLIYGLIASNIVLLILVIILRS